MLGMAGCSSSPQDKIKKEISSIDLELLPSRWTNGPAKYYSGYGNDSGEFVMEWEDPFKHGRLSMFCNGLAGVRVENTRGFFNPEGEMVIDMSAYKDFLPYMTEGVAIAHSRNSDTSVAVDSKGEVKFEFDGKIITPMRAGYALYEHKRHRNDNGVVNSKGEIVYEPGSDERINDFTMIGFGNPASMAHPTWFPLVNGGKLICFLDVATGKRHFEGLWPEGARMSWRIPLAVDANDRIVIQGAPDKIGLMKLDGTWAVEPEYRYMAYDGDWYLFENSDGLVGWMDKDGKVMIEPQFKVSDVSETRFGVSDWCLVNPRKGDRFFIDCKGEVVLEPEFLPESNFIGDRCLVKLKGRGAGWQWMNRQGELVGDQLYLTEDAVKYIAFMGRGIAVQYLPLGF